MNIAYIYIIAVVSIAGMTAIAGSLWKGLCYVMWIAAALAFWWALAVAIWSLGSGGVL